MFANRILLMRPALYAPIAPQIRAFSLARIALEPARKTAPPPPPPLAKGRKAASTTKSTVAAKSASTTKTASAAKATPTTAAKRTTSAATKKATPAPAPTTRVRLTEKERAARDRAEEREKAARAREKEREREKLRKAKEREKALEKKEKAKEREQLRKEREKTKLEISEAIKKPYPPPPKGPKTAYLMFSTDPTVKRDRGEGVTEDATLASQAWKALSEAERDVYNKKYEKARAAWKEDVAKWVASLNLAQLKAARVNREPGTRDDAAMDTLPKRPGNAYALFLADVTSREDFRNKIDALVQKEGIKDNKELVKKRISLYGRTSADIWKSMSDQEKAVYTTKATQAKAQWDKQFGHLIAAQKEVIAANLS